MVHDYVDIDTGSDTDEMLRCEGVSVKDVQDGWGIDIDFGRHLNDEYLGYIP